MPRSRQEIFSVKQICVLPTIAPVRMPAGLSHVDSDLCWCDPLFEVDENGNLVVIHREITWN